MLPGKDIHDPSALLATHPFYNLLDPETSSWLKSHVQLVRFTPGTNFIDEGQSTPGFYFLSRGTVRIWHRDAEGTEISVGFFQAPCVFGEIEYLSGIEALESVTGITDGVAYRVSHEHLEALLHKCPTFAITLLRDVSSRFCSVVDAQRAIAFDSVPQRLCALLLSYAEVFGTRLPGERILIDSLLTQEQLARDLAVSRRSITRAMSDLMPETLSKQNGKVTIENLNSLRSRCNAQRLRVGKNRNAAVFGPAVSKQHTSAERTHHNEPSFRLAPVRRAPLPRAGSHR